MKSVMTNIEPFPIHVFTSILLFDDDEKGSLTKFKKATSPLHVWDLNLTTT